LRATSTFSLTTRDPVCIVRIEADVTILNFNSTHTSTWCSFPSAAAVASVSKFKSIGLLAVVSAKEAIAP